tara:strand:+ start:4505 stop:5548 length:1044 start_codon:yes stop_codon:yes gene_type:complete
MVGKLYDPRLSIYGLNIIAFVNSLPLIFGFFYLISSREINRHFLWFIVIIILTTIYTFILFNYYGVNIVDNYSFDKIIYLYLVLTPLILYKYVNGFDKYFYGALFFACFVFFVFGLSRVAGDSARLALFGGGPIVFSRWICIFLILCANFIKHNLVKWFVISLCLLLIIKAGSKGPFVFLIIAMSFQYIKGFGFKRLLLVILICCILYQFFDFILELLGPRLSVVFSNDLLDASSSIGRLERWRMAIRVFLENPSGVGLGNYVPVTKSIEANDFYIAEYPHNLFLELISELGVWGVGLVFVIMRKTFKMLNNSNVNLVDKQLLIFLLLNSMVSGDIIDSRFLFVFLI